MTFSRWMDELNQIEKLKEGGGRIVVASGCFDFLHLGHLSHLTEARALGDFLLVLISDDLSVKAMKGPERPVFKEEDRKALLLALAPVDSVMIHPQAQLVPLLQQLAPCTFVKGPDYNGITPKWLKDIVGEIVVTGDSKADSTSLIIERCASIHAEYKGRLGLN